MFSGIISQTPQVLLFERFSKSKEATLTIKAKLPSVELGESIAINGVCLTVTEFRKQKDFLEIDFHLSSETLEKSNLSELQSGSRVHLERALQLGDRLSGHWVQGHVDGIGQFHQLKGVAPESALFQVKIPKALSRYCVLKGSITLDGVSLTLNEIQNDLISIQLVPHSQEMTRFSELQSGDPINIEVDVLAKYVEKLFPQPKEPLL